MKAEFSNQEIEEIRKQVVAFQSQGKGWSYPDEFRARILTLAEAIGGVNAARKTGVSIQSIEKWAMNGGRKLANNSPLEKTIPSIQVTRISPEPGTVRQDAAIPLATFKPNYLGTATVAGVHFEFHDAHAFSQVITQLARISQVYL